jgi:hypothetical protein
MKHMLQPEDADGWVLLLAQLPASPSGPRVALWRRARAAGAAGLVNGVWVLPGTAAHVALFRQFAETVRGQGGSAFVLAVPAPGEDVDAEITGRFGEDRAREYAEFAERSAGLLTEIGKESGRGKFTFAELEEIEQDLDRLSAWLEKVAARDFFPGTDATRAAGTLQRCQEAVAGFARAVYAAEGLEAPGTGPDSGAGPGPAGPESDPPSGGTP